LEFAIWAAVIAIDSADLATRQPLRLAVSSISFLSDSPLDRLILRQQHQVEFDIINFPSRLACILHLT